MEALESHLDLLGEQTLGKLAVMSGFCRSFGPAQLRQYLFAQELLVRVGVRLRRRHAPPESRDRAIHASPRGSVSDRLIPVHAAPALPLPAGRQDLPSTLHHEAHVAQRPNDPHGVSDNGDDIRRAVGLQVSHPAAHIQ